MFYMARYVGYATLAIGLVCVIAFMNNEFLLEVSVATTCIGFGVYGIGIYEPEILWFNEFIKERFTKYIDRQSVVSYTYQTQGIK